MLSPTSKEFLTAALTAWSIIIISKITPYFAFFIFWGSSLRNDHSLGQIDLLLSYFCPAVSSFSCGCDLHVILRKILDGSGHEIISEQPYYQEGQKKIYIPFFSRSLNQIYFEEPEKLLTSPYAGLKDKFQDTVVDPFDTYGSELYNSHFSRLVKVKQEDKETAFFHYDTNTIYFVNEQGRLDGTVVLFDRYLRRPSYSHMLERIRPVVDAYFNFDREGFINALYDNGFISSHLLHLIRFHDWAKLWKHFPHTI